jgi:molecular chaperone Hsp33
LNEGIKDIMSTTSDKALRALSEDGTFRILVANTTETAAGILKAQSPPASLRSTLVDLTGAAVLLRLTMSPDNRLQAILQNQEAGTLVCDTHPEGITRGLVHSPKGSPLQLGDGTFLSVHRTMYDGQVHQGVVETDAEQTLADAVTGYLDRSEQIASVVGLDHRFDGDELTFAGGYIIQIVPANDEVDQADLAFLTARLQHRPPVDELFEICDFDIEKVTSELFGPIEHDILGDDEFHAGCICSPERILQALSTLSEAERQELKSGDDDLEVGCDYCGTTHHIAPDRI